MAEDRIRFNKQDNRLTGPTLFADGGEMGDRISSFDWSNTCLGDIQSWPNSLQLAVKMMLLYPAPQAILWGVNGIALYNDAYIDFAADRHPTLLGKRGSEVWPEGEQFINHVISKCLQGESLTYKRQYHLVYRSGIPEDIWMDLYCSPLLDDSGCPAGASIINIETTQYVKAEQTLEASEARLKRIIEGSNDGIWEYNLKAKCSEWNDRLWEIIGYSPEEVEKPGYHFLQSITHPDDKDKVKNTFIKTCSEGSHFNVEYRVQHRKGHYIHIHEKAKPVYNEQGEIISIAGITTDITKRKNAELALMETETRFRTMADASGILIASTDETGNAVYFNKEWLDLTGRSMETLINYGWADLFHPDDREDFVEAYLKAVENKKPLMKEFRILNKAGEWRWQLAIVSPRTNTLGTYTGHISSCIDITERKLAEEALKESEERFRILADAAPYMVWAIKSDYTTLYVNKYTLEFLGISYEQFIAHTWTPFIHPDDLPVTKEVMKDAVDNKEIYSVEQRLLRYDGEYRWLLTQGAPSYFPNGELFGYVGSSIDITQRKEAEEELEKKNIQLMRTNNDLDNFIYTASHDLRSPIVNLDGLLIALNKRLATTITPEASTLLSLMDTSIKQLDKTIKDLAEITKAQKSLEETIEEVRFKEILEDVKAGIQVEIRTISPTITEDFKVLTIRYLPGNLRSILYNLVSNALKYRSAERPLTIAIKTYQEDDFVVLSVTDNGLGINDQQLPKLFTMFKRLHTHVEGTGIGLYIIKRLVENSGGKIEVSSQPGKGSSFKVYLRQQN